MKILIVDDDQDIRDLLRLFLEREGHTVLDADNGKSGIELQRSNNCEVLICDLIMPVQEGIETITQFKDEYPAVGVIAISGGGKIGAESYLTVAKQLGAWKVFMKPLDREKLVNAIDEWSEKYQEL